MTLEIKEAKDGWEALGQVLRSLPDVIILNISLPILAAIDIANYIQRRVADTLIIMLNTSREPLERQEIVRGRSRVMLLPKDQFAAFTAIPVSREIRNFFAHTRPTTSRLSGRRPFDGSSLRLGAADKPGLQSSDDARLLSSRELDVLRQIAHGLTTQDAADKLSISPTTVRSHSAALYQKLGVRSRGEAIAKAEEAGLLDATNN
jgi:DNA-binding NarL/FixJ family response regulator